MSIVPGTGFIHARWPAPDNVMALTTTRLCGVSPAPYDSFNLAHHVNDETDLVNTNRERLMALAGIDCPVQWLKQVHGTRVVTANRVVPGGTLPEADAVVLEQPGTAGAVLTADCLPVFFSALNGTKVAVAHAGWRGLAAGILEQTITAMAVPPGQLTVWFGPAIARCHFEVGDDVRAAFIGRADNKGIRTTMAAAFDPVVDEQRGTKWMADLYTLARTILEERGITSINGCDLCTYCDDRFYSYRENPITGRMASLICLKP